MFQKIVNESNFLKENRIIAGISVMLQLSDTINFMRESVMEILEQLQQLLGLEQLPFNESTPDAHISVIASENINFHPPFNILRWVSTDKYRKTHYECVFVLLPLLLLMIDVATSQH